MKVKLIKDLAGSFSKGVKCVTLPEETKWRRKYIYDIPREMFNKDIFEKVGTSKKE